MTDSQTFIRDRLRELERAFGAFEKGQRNRLFESRDALLGLTEGVETGGWEALGPICEIASRLLGIVLMEGGLDEGRAVAVVRELLGYVEGQILESQEGIGAEAPGGVFHVVNSERVGDMLVRRGVIGPDQLEKALLLQRVSKGKRVGQVLVAMNAIDQRTLDSTLENQKSETRRAETRRSSTLGQGSMRVTPLPPVPGMPAPDPEPAPLRMEPGPVPNHLHTGLFPKRNLGPGAE